MAYAMLRSYAFLLTFPPWARTRCTSLSTAGMRWAWPTSCVCHTNMGNAYKLLLPHLSRSSAFMQYFTYLQSPLHMRLYLCLYLYLCLCLRMCLCLCVFVCASCAITCNSLSNIVLCPPAIPVSSTRISGVLTTCACGYSCLSFLHSSAIACIADLDGEPVSKPKSSNVRRRVNE